MMDAEWLYLRAIGKLVDMSLTVNIFHLLASLKLIRAEPSFLVLYFVKSNISRGAEAKKGSL